jgi:hypothetical protein
VSDAQGLDGSAAQCGEQNYTKDPVQHARCNVAALKFQQDELNHEFATNQVGLETHHNLPQRALGLSVFLPVVGWAGRAVGWLRRATGALRSIIAGERAVALADDAYTTFYTVQDAHDIARLRGTGEPWPTDPMRSGLGEGVYAWATRSEAEAYLAHRSRTVEGLRIVSFRVSNARLAAYRRLVVDSLQDADAWMERYSKVWGGVPDHGFEYIQRGTRIGVEHFFDKSIFGDLEFS